MTPDSSLLPRRVLLTTGNFVNVVDGVALTLNRLVRYLEEVHGVEVMILAPHTKTPAISGHAGKLVMVPSLALPFQPEYQIAMGLPAKIRKEIEAFKPDFVHIATPDWLGNKALKWARSQSLPVVTSFHSNLMSYFPYIPGLGGLQKLGWKMMRNFYNNCDQTYVPTQSMEDELRGQGITNGLRRWERGVDSERFSPSKRSTEWREQHGIAQDEVVVLFAARLRWEKGLKLLTAVLQRLEKKFSDTDVKFRSVVVGDGVGAKPMQKWLPNTVFTGHLSGDDLPTAYASSELFLYPCETDTFGAVTLEAMASGLPTVCARAPGARSIVVDEKTGFLATPRDEDEFFEFTAKLVADASLRKTMADAAYHRSHDFTWDKALGRLMEHYVEVLQGDREQVQDTVAAPV